MKKLMNGNAPARKAPCFPAVPAILATPSPLRTSWASTWPRGSRRCRGAYSSSRRARSRRSTWCLARASRAPGRMTSSSSPGISLKQEGISYLAADELPAVIVNMSRGGPGMGNISPAQSDYFQATRGGGHGDYRTIVLAPSSVQEIADLMPLAFDLADTYRNPVVVLGRRHARADDGACVASTA